jgi:tRNA threonylcarbamoyladenosine biosynthesis protein TsaB
MPYLLHIESATENCSIALSEGEKLIKVLSENNTQRHSEIITLLIEEVLSSSGIGYKDLNAVSLSEGPGSYTSLRVGTSAAKAICYAMSIPLISINTLTSLALDIYQKNRDNCFYFPMIDARRMEVYGALYDKDMTPVFENRPVILTEFDINHFINIDSKVFLTGNGADKAMQVFKNPKISNTNRYCKAENLIFPAFFKWKNNDFSDVAYFSPNYIKPPNITLPKPK